MNRLSIETWSVLGAISVGIIVAIGVIEQQDGAENRVQVSGSNSDEQQNPKQCDTCTVRVAMEKGLSQLTGKWSGKNSSGVSLEVNGNIVTFVECAEWPELAGKQVLLAGPVGNFIFDGYWYAFCFRSVKGGEDIDDVSLLRNPLEKENESDFQEVLLERVSRP